MSLLFTRPLYTLTFVFILLAANSALAQFSTFPKVRVGMMQSSYSGEEGKSFQEAGSGYGLEVSAQRDGEYFAPNFRFRLHQLSGKQKFYDGSSLTSDKHSFQFTQAQAEIGVQFFPLARNKKGINLYLYGGGAFSYNHIALGSNTTVTTIPKSDQTSSFGYTGALGVEWILGTTEYKWTPSLEVQLHEETMTLLEKNNFRDGRFSILFGLGF